jgi:acetyltransferase-like isoleucine patch superfamily enzyme
MYTSFLSVEEIRALGFKSVGKCVKISRNAKFYSPDKIEIGNNVRIDDFCILSGNIKLGSNIHISPYVVLYGAMGIELEDYTGISARTTVYSAMDDFSGEYLVGPVHPEGSTNVTGGKVLIKKYTQIGAHCLVFPNITIGEGVAVGACSMVKSSLEPWAIYFGMPARKFKDRAKDLIKYLY